MPKLLEKPQILEAAFEPQRIHADVAGGAVVAYSCRDPEKDTENEDTAAIIPYGPGAAALVVADGAGGLPAGKRASQTAVTTLADSLQSSVKKTVLLRTAILNGIDAANAAVLGLANGSATTMTVVTIEGLHARSYHVGDSEAIVVGQRGRLQAANNGAFAYRLRGRGRLSGSTRGPASRRAPPRFEFYRHD